MGFGFIPRTDGNVDHGQSVNSIIEMAEAQHLADALELEGMVKEYQEDVFKEVQRFAELLGQLDPTNYNTAQEMGQIVLGLSYARTSHERLDKLTSEARRLMKAVATAKHHRRRRWMLSAAAVFAGVCVTGICAATIL